MLTPYDCGPGAHTYIVTLENLDESYPRLVLITCEACGDPISRWRTAPPIPEAFDNALPDQEDSGARGA